MTERLQNLDQFIKHQDPPAEWVAALEAVSPPNEDVPYLKLWWRAGWWYEPVQRWVLYEILPPKWFAKIIAGQKVRGDGISFIEEILNDLKGPDPRKEGHWYADATCIGGRRWFSDSLVDHDQWRLYRLTGGIPQLYWIIQGEQGGHKRVLQLQEVKLLEAAGYPNPDVPNAGALPYAPFDNRVLEKIKERDKLQAWDRRFNRDFSSRIADQDAAVGILAAEREELRLAARQALNKWLVTQIVEPAAEDLAHHIRNVTDLPIRPAVTDEDAVEQQFLEG